VRIENPKTQEIDQEVRYLKGVLYTQNRSHDIEISFDDFIDRCKVSKQKAIKSGANMICDMVEIDTLWNQTIRQ